MDHILLPHTVDTPPNEEPAFDEAEIMNALVTTNSYLDQTRSFDDLYDAIMNPHQHAATSHRPDEDPEEQFQDLLETLEFEDTHLQRLYAGPEVSINRESKLLKPKHQPKAELLALRKEADDTGKHISKGKKRARDHSLERGGQHKRVKINSPIAKVGTTIETTTESSSPTTIISPVSDTVAITKSSVEEYDVATPLHESVLDKKFVAIWTQVDPAKTYKRKTVWEADPMFHKYLRPLLYEYGWSDAEFVIPKRNSLCPYRGPDGQQCTAKNSSHHNRHMVSHVPDGIGYFFVCPACKMVFRRADMFSRHKGTCKVYSGRKIPRNLKCAYKQNIFLRLPWTQKLEDLSREQKKKRDEGEIQFWLLGDEWDETDARIPSSDKSRTKTPAGLNPEQPRKKVLKSRQYRKASTSQRSSSRVKTNNKLVD